MLRSIFAPVFVASTDSWTLSAAQTGSARDIPAKTNPMKSTRNRNAARAFPVRPIANSKSRVKAIAQISHFLPQQRKVRFLSNRLLDRASPSAQLIVECPCLVAVASLTNSRSLIDNFFRQPAAN
jgi:hypothetical protein